MAYFLCPRKIADVDEAIDTRLELHEGAELRDVADDAAVLRTHRIFFEEERPRVRLQLLEAERNLLRVLIDVENDRLRLLPKRQQRRGVLDVLRPGHFADVNEPFDALFEFDKGAVVRHRNDLALDAL